VDLPVIDGCWRVAYWIGFRLLRLWWWLRRPDHRGALVAVWLDGRILAVRQSYRTNLSWPGGGIRHGEDPGDAARRELAEELGLVVQSADLVLVREMIVDWDFCRRVFSSRRRCAPRPDCHRSCVPILKIGTMHLSRIAYEPGCLKFLLPPCCMMASRPTDATRFASKRNDRRGAGRSTLNAAC
jgi:hypothetical protein